MMMAMMVMMMVMEMMVGDDDGDDGDDDDDDNDRDDDGHDDSDNDGHGGTDDVMMVQIVIMVEAGNVDDYENRCKDKTDGSDDGDNVYLYEKESN